MRLINKRSFKQVVLVMMMLGLLFVTGTTNPSQKAIADDNKSSTVEQGIMDSFTTEKLGLFKNNSGSNYYYLDMVAEKDANKIKEDSTWEDIKDSMFGWADVKGNFTDNFNLTLNSLANIALRINVFLTSTMITILDFSFSVDVVLALISSLEESVKKMAGISAGGSFTNSGLFGGMLYLIAILAAVYALYTFVLKRAFMESFGTVLKTILALTLALMFLSNYSGFLKTTQNLSNEMTAYVMGLSNWGNSSNSGYTEAPTISDSEVKSDVRNSMWTMFVDRPYLYMQYGTHDLEKISGGNTRVANLLKLKPGEERNEKVLTSEIKQYNNNLMVSSSALDRLAFTPFYLLINGVVSVPIFALALMLIVLQFWFIVIAAIAPFALLISAIPGFFGVIKRYAIELAIPLILKVFFAFFTILLLVLSEALYAINIANLINTNPVVDYIFVAVFQFVLFITVFLLRKRIMNIFSSGSEVIAGLRESSGSLNPINHARKGIQTTASLAGTAIGAGVGGVAGAAVGSNVGSTLGRVATGESSFQEVGGSAMSLARFGQLSKLGKGKGNAKEEVDLDNSTSDLPINLSKTDDAEENKPENQYQSVGLQEEAENDQYIENDQAVWANIMENEEAAEPRVEQDSNSPDYYNEANSSAGPIAEEPYNGNHNLSNVEAINEETDLQSASNEGIESASSNINSASMDDSNNTSISSAPLSSSMESKASTFNNMDSTPATPVANLANNNLEGDPMAFKNEPTGNVDTTPLSAGALATSNLANSGMKSTMMKTESLSSNGMTTSELENNEILNSSMETAALDNNSIANSGFDNTPMNSSSMESSSYEGLPIESPSLNSSMMGGSTLESSALNESPLRSSDMSGSALNSTEAQNISSESSNDAGSNESASSNSTAEDNSQRFPKMTPLRDLTGSSPTNSIERQRLDEVEGESE